MAVVEGWMTRFVGAISHVLLLTATFVLVALAAILVGYACWTVVRAFREAADPTHAAVEAISLIIIAFAVTALSKYIVEEEIEHKRELASARDARRSLTKFITIIIVAFSLEALVMVFDASRGDLAATVYPIALFCVAVLALVGLGVYQWLSNEVEPALPNEAAQEKQRKKT
jgi:hypothetical protein